jgi:hypothetical protein
MPNWTQAWDPLASVAERPLSLPFPLLLSPGNLAWSRFWSGCRLGSLVRKQGAVIVQIKIKGGSGDEAAFEKLPHSALRIHREGEALGTGQHNSKSWRYSRQSPINEKHSHIDWGARY